MKTILIQHPELFFIDGRGHVFFYRNRKGKRFVLDIFRSGGEWHLAFRELSYRRVYHAKSGRILFLPQQGA